MSYTGSWLGILVSKDTRTIFPFGCTFLQWFTMVHYGKFRPC